MSDHEASPAPSLREALEAMMLALASAREMLGVLEDHGGHDGLNGKGYQATLDQMDDARKLANLALAQPAPAAPTPEYVSGWLARGKKDASECDAVTERYAPGGKGSPIPTTWPEVASRMCADRVRAVAPPVSAPALDDRLLLLKALGGGRASLCMLSGVPHVGLPDMEIDAGTRWIAAPLDAEGFPILTDALRAALLEAVQ